MNHMVYTIFSPSLHHHLNLFSPGCAVCVPGAWFLHSNAAGEQPHVPTVQDHTCPEGGAMEGCTLPGLWASGKQNDWDHLPANDNDCWWNERFGRSAHTPLSHVKLISLSYISLSGISLFFLPWWIRYEVQTKRNCWASQGGGHHCVSIACKDSEHSGALRAQLASQETTVKCTQSNVVWCCTHWRTPQIQWDK